MQAGLRTRHITTVIITTACRNATHSAIMHVIVIGYILDVANCDWPINYLIFSWYRPLEMWVFFQMRQPPFILSSSSAAVVDRDWLKQSLKFHIPVLNSTTKSWIFAYWLVEEMELSDGSYLSSIISPWIQHPRLPSCPSGQGTTWPEPLTGAGWVRRLLLFITNSSSSYSLIIHYQLINYSLLTH